MSVFASFKSWQLYEKFVARIVADQLSTDLCVTPNARIAGQISKRTRQIDVLIDSRHEPDSSRRIIVDAKMRTRKIDVTHVEAFKGLMEDVGARHGYLVCPVGHTKAAQRRAQGMISITLVPIEDLKHFDPTRLELCQGKCKSGYVFWDGYPEVSVGLAPLSPELGMKAKRVPFVHCVGKCDQCATFHVRCLTCQELFSLTDEADHQCQCQPLWFWLTSVERDEEGRKAAELHLIYLTGEIVTVSRRPME